MEKFENNGYEFEETESKTLKDYLALIKNNLIPVLLIIGVGLAAAVVYALSSKDIFKSTATLKLSKPQGNILQSPLTPDFGDYGMDRFIANEIEIIKSYNMRERVAEALTDTFYNRRDKSLFYLILNHDDDSSKNILKTVPSIASVLSNNISVEQKRGLDMVDLSAESPSPFEAALITNTYLDQYKKLNLEVNRNQLTFVKNFLDDQLKEKKKELSRAEESLRIFQEKGGVIALDEQATALISQLSQFEAQLNAAKIDLSTSDAILKQYKEELKKQDPRMADYLESLTSEAYITALQQQLAELQINKDLALSNSDSKIDVTAKVKEYDQKIDELKGKLGDKIDVIKAGIFASSPTEVKELSQKIIEEEVKNNSLDISIKGLQNVVDRYEEKFDRLPKTSLELARLQRHRESLEKLYTLVEEKYQEALINEQSQPGNVLIIDRGRMPSLPAKPNRPLIILIGLVLGAGLAFGYVLVKDYFDTTVKTPEDIEKKNINVLAWIPGIEGAGLNGTKQYEFTVLKKPDSMPSEAFRALRTRIQFSKVDSDSLKTLLITSSAPQEGKTVISINLAGSFAQSDKKVLLLDCDLRKPRIHSVFNSDKTPGLVDHLFNRASLDEIIRPAEMKNLSYITSGTIPPNPAEILESSAMKDFLNGIRKEFDIIIVDSAPIIAVADSEILSRMVDGTILVVSSENTESELMQRSVDLIKHDRASFLGTALNNFGYKNGYGAYYKYYYYYSQNGAKETKVKK